MDTKIPFYNLINIFLLGVVFVSGVIYLFYPLICSYSMNNVQFIKKLINDSFLFSLCIACNIYTVGIVVNRFSSIVIEFLFEKFKLIPKTETRYACFNEARKTNPFLYTLSREYAFSRGHTALWLILTILSLCRQYWGISLAFLLLTILFSFSMRKFSYKIYNVIENYKNEKFKK